MMIRIIRHIKLNHELGLLLEVKDDDVPQRSFLRLFTTLVRAVISVFISILSLRRRSLTIPPHHPIL